MYLCSLITVFSWFSPMLVPNGITPDGHWLQYKTPEEAGFSSQALEEAFALTESGNTAALMVLVEGRVLIAWGPVASRYKCYSVRKSIYSALFGIFRDQGTINLDKSLADLGIEDIQGLSEKERQATIRQLISARSGVFHPAAKEPFSMKRSRPKRGSHEPGTRFFYNNWDFNTAAIILEQETGEELFDSFQNYLAEPLGMQDYRPKDGFHEFDRSASQFSAHAFRLSARDLAKIGQLYLQRGRWQGVRLLSEAWIKESTSVTSDMPPYSYGYMWWVIQDAKILGGEGTVYAALGTGGQMLLVDEAAKIVLVHRGDTDHGPGVRDRDIFAIYRSILAARTGVVAREPKLVPMRATALKGRQLATPVPKIIAIDPSHLNSLTGTFKMPNDILVSLRALPDRLIGSHPMLGEVDFFPLSATEFSAYNQNIRLVFGQEKQGSFQQIALDLDGQKMVLTRVKD